LGIFDIEIEEAMDKAIMRQYNLFFNQGATKAIDDLPTLAEDMLWGQETELSSEVSEILTRWLLARLEKRILGVKTNSWDSTLMSFMGD
jgi:hypothetical protein